MKTREKRQEIDHKAKLLGKIMREKGLSGILLRQQKNFFWATAGGGNPVMFNYDPGFQSVFFTEKDRFILSQQVEMPRIRDEEAADLGYQFEQYNWWEEDLYKSVSALTSGRIGCDIPHPEMTDINGEMGQLRTEMTDWELSRFGLLGRDCAQCMDQTMAQVEKGMTEREIGALLLSKLVPRGIRAHVLLVGNDERAIKYRHPIPTEKPLENYVMIGLCGERHGLIAALTRLMHFGDIPKDLSVKYEALKNVAAIFNLATKPEAIMGDIFEIIKAAYEENGYPGEWKLHYQGGICGYVPREVPIGPGSEYIVQKNHVFAWNPTITGTKIEDTFIVKKNGPENLTLSEDWPQSRVSTRLGEIVLPEIMIR